MNPFLATLLLVAGFGLLANYLIKTVLSRSESESERRVRELIREEMEGTQFSMPEEKKEGKRKKKRSGSPTVDAVSAYLERNKVLQRGEGKTFIDWLDSELVVAGIRYKMTPYQALATTLLIWFVGVILPTFMVLAGGLPKFLYVMMVVLFLLYPPLKLRQIKTNRQDDLRMELPTFIQQLRMLLSTRTSTLDDAIARVVRNAQLDPYDSQLAREFGQAQTEYRLGGVDREEALRRIGERTQVASVQNLVDVIIQGLRTGTEMEGVLGEYGKQARETWRQDMRTYMARKEPLVTISVVITMFGGFILFAAPLVLNLARTLSSV